MRSMKNSFKKWEFYKSTFDEDTGIIVRDVVVPEQEDHGYYRSKGTLLAEYLQEVHRIDSSKEYSLTEYDRGVVSDIKTAWYKRFGRFYSLGKGKGKERVGTAMETREKYPFSPVPETIDIQINNWCDYGCSYCYMNSTKKGGHADRSLLERVFSGLKTPPYQIAFGGGEPTAHPDFPWFLQYTREQGTVPNYTTAGHLIREDVIEATNKYAGGVALTYHREKGFETFTETFNKWNSLLRSTIPINIHVLFDNYVAESLQLIEKMCDRNFCGRSVNVVLLAYYPDVGRASMDRLPCKSVYMDKAPRAIKRMLDKQFPSLSFSEGLLPYFLSRNLLPTFSASRQEGIYSCYISMEGRVSSSSFSPPDKDYPNIHEKKLQTIWDKAQFKGSYFRTLTECDMCSKSFDCVAPDVNHALICAYAQHNLPNGM